MALRLEIEIKVKEKSVNTSGLANSGFEAESESIIREGVSTQIW